MDNIFIVTDSCMWEKNKQEGKIAPHSIEVVDEISGQVRYIKGGSKIKFMEGEITEAHTQEGYNKEQETCQQDDQ